MEFVRVIDGFDHLWAVKDPEQEADELTLLFRRWSDMGFLMDFFMNNLDDLSTYFHISRISDAIKDTIYDACQLEKQILGFPQTKNLDSLFTPLGTADSRMALLTREKARNWNRSRHASWLRVYAIRLNENVFVVTGGAIKLTHTMQEREHTMDELTKLDKCRDYLQGNGVFDQPSFMDYINDK